jgi:hypothetical protein
MGFGSLIGNKIKIMKAKEYFQKYVDENQDKEPLYRVVKTMIDMFNEVKEIQVIRKAQSNSAMISIMNEQNIKCNSFINKVNAIDGLGVKRDAFKGFINNQMPELGLMIGWS